MCEPDPRNLFFSRFDASGDGLRSATVLDQLNDVAQFSLCAEVPEAVRIHFETAKNLYAYAWFVYRFHGVAEQQALTSLEFALRERLCAEIAQSKGKSACLRKGLGWWLKEALARKVISNERLPRRREWALQRARARAEREKIEEMERTGATSMQVDYSNLHLLPEDLEFDQIGIFIKNLPDIRNAYAHGSSLLHPEVLGTFEIVCNLVNQLFSSSNHD